MSHPNKKKTSSPAPNKGRARTVLRVVLVAFVVIAVAVLIAREVRSRTAQASNDGSGTPTAVGTPSLPETVPTTVDTGLPANGVMAYYFHATARCSSCITIEKWTADAIHTEFAAELAGGTLTWRVLDVQEPASAHFIQDYQLVSQSVVLVRYTNGKPGKWENLQMVWQLLGDNEAFVDYITSSTRSFLDSKE